MSESARVIIEVVAGVLPGTPEPEHTRRWGITSEDWMTATRAGTNRETLAVLNGKAIGYAMWLMTQPERLNWVRMEWLWM